MIDSSLGGGCAYTGEDAAYEELNRAETRIVRELQLHSPYDEPAWMARRAVDNSYALDPSLGSPAFGLTVEPLDWYGTGWTATLELRLRADAAERQSQGFNDRSYAAGSAERCLRVAFGGSSGNNADEINCGGRVAKPIPPPKSVPSLDDGAPARLASALRADSFTAARQPTEKSFSAFAVDAEIIDEVWAISVIAPSTAGWALGQLGRGSRFCSTSVARSNRRPPSLDLPQRWQCGFRRAGDDGMAPGSPVWEMAAEVTRPELGSGHRVTARNRSSTCVQPTARPSMATGGG